jgi:tetratricopeptide (TPR) repeat protein
VPREAGMSPAGARLALGHMRVPDKEYSDCYVLGCFEKRVTVRSQQIRALNLVCALHTDDKLKSGKVLVIGGGAGGMTAAAAAARLGYEVTLLEQKGVLLPIFRGNNTRWLHPSIYDWPELPGRERHDGGSQAEDEAGLPLLDWKAGLAQDVADQFDKAWAALPERSLIQVVLNAGGIHLGEGGPRYVSWSTPRENGHGRFDAIILAVGFGFEREFPGVPRLSYWDNERLHQPTRGGVESYLVSGCGDGGLIDLLRLKLEDFRHETVRKLVSAPGLAPVKAKLLEIEEEARRHDAPEVFLQEEYRKLSVPPEVDSALRLRTDTEVTLNGEADSPLTLRASILSRFLASRLLYGTNPVGYRPGKFTLKRSGAGYEVQFKFGKPVAFQHVLIRHGPGPTAMEEGFSAILEKCGPLRARNELDQTRAPLWRPGFFSPETQQPPTPPSPPPDTSASGGKIIGSTVGSLQSGFKGREGTLKQLRALLEEAGKVSVTGGAAGLVYAHGSGGMGKSRLAIEYMHRYQHEYSGGVFFSYVAEKTPLAVFAEFARELFGAQAPSLESEAARRFAQWFQEDALGPRLLVFDDVQARTREELARRFSDSTQVDGQLLWPVPHAHVHLLFTTRMRDLENEVQGAKGLSVERLDADSALALLLERASTRRFSPEEQAQARSLASEELGGHPLALWLAGAFLGRVKNISVAGYRQNLREKGLTYNLEQAAQVAGHTIRDHERSIVATYDLSRAQLEPSNTVDALARRLLDLAAFLSPGTRIDSKLFARLLRVSGVEADPVQLGLALARLTTDLSLLDGVDGEVMIHPLIADYTRWRIQQEGRQENLNAILLMGMRGLFPNSPDEFWRITRPDAHHEWEHLSVEREAHVTSVWSLTQVVESQDRTVLSWILGDLYLLRGSLNRAREVFEQALEVGKRLAEREPENSGWQRDVSVSLNKVGGVLLEQGNLEGARRAFEQDLEIAQRLAEREPENSGWQRDVSVSLERVGDVLFEQGNLEGARRTFEQVLEVRQRLAEREPENSGWQRDVSVSLEWVGKVLHAQGNLEGARRAFEQALEVRQRLAEREPENSGWQRDVSVSLNRLGDVLLEQGNLEGARRAFEQALEVRQRLAEREPENSGWQRDVSVSLARVGDVLRAQGNLEGARRAFEQALEVGKRLAEREPENSGWQRDVSVSLNRLGGVLLAQGNLEGARRAFEQALEVMQRLAAREPENSGWQRDVSVSLNRVGGVLLAQGNLEGARRAFEQDLEIAQRLATREPENSGWQRDVSVSLNKVGEVLLEQGNLEGARRAFEQALEVRQRLAAREPEHTGWQVDLVFSQFKTAGVLAPGSAPERAQAVSLLTQAQDTLRRLAAAFRLTNVQQHKLLPAVEAVLRRLQDKESR